MGPRVSQFWFPGSSEVSDETSSEPFDPTDYGEPEQLEIGSELVGEHTKSEETKTVDVENKECQADKKKGEAEKSEFEEKVEELSKKALEILKNTANK